MGKVCWGWFTPTILLCLCGFFRSVNPSESYLTPYLMGPRKNLTASECVNQIFPVWTYSYLVFLIPVFLLTDYFKYKPVVVFQNVCFIGCWMLLLFGEGVFQMQIMQVIFGMGTAAEIGYYSYIYSIVPEERYQRVTSITRSVVLFGFFLGGLLAQLLVSLANIDYFYLNVIALVNICIGFFFSLFLPTPKKTLFFYSNDDLHKNENNTLLEEKFEKETNTDSNEKSDKTEKSIVGKKKNRWKKVLTSAWKDIKVAYSNLTILRWSVWWALSTCGYMLVVNYIQNLWETIYSSSDHNGIVYNGAVESASTVLGGLGSLAVGYIKLDWKRWGELALGISSIFKCGLLLAIYFVSNIWASYAFYILYIFLYNIVITIAQYQLAVGLNTKRIALVLGVNTFMAVGLNMILTLVVIDKVGFGLDPKTLFLLYSVYFAVLAVIFLGHTTYSFFFMTSKDDKKVDDDNHENNSSIKLTETNHC